MNASSPRGNARRFHPLRRRAAFTLIEVTMALGIASFAIVSMLGVMAVGMKTLRGAIDTSIQATITQDIVGSLKQTDFSAVADSSAWNRMYDERGVVTTQEGERIYTTAVAFEPMTLSGGTANPNLIKARVQITRINDPANPYVFTTFLSNNGQ